MAKGLKLGNGVLAAPRGAIIIGIVGMVLTTAMGFVLMAVFPWTESTFSLDRFLYSLASPTQEWIAMRLQVIDEPVVVAVILLGMGIIVLFSRGLLPALGAMVVAGFGWLAIAAVKLVVAEPRPTSFFPELQEQALSFPSGHVVFVVALAVAVGAVVTSMTWRWILVGLLIVLALVTAWSRLYLGVHYPLDVIGGMLGGFSGAVLVLGVWNAILRRAQRSRSGS